MNGLSQVMPTTCCPIITTSEHVCPGHLCTAGSILALATNPPMRAAAIVYGSGTT